jgi:hypothetical protein
VVHNAQIHEGVTGLLKGGEETSQGAGIPVKPKPGVVDDVPEIHQPFSEKEVEGGRLVLGNYFEMSAGAIPNQVPILEVKEACK